MKELSMPRKPDKPCAHPGCAKLVPPGEMYCGAHKAFHPKERETRPAASRGYNRDWQEARLFFLEKHPLCVECEKEGRYVRATVVDHIIPHRGDMKLFWDSDNWQSLCKHHHDVKTKTIDREYIKTHPWADRG